MKTKAEYRAMSEFERKRVINLSKCRLPAYSFVRRFVRSLTEQAHCANPKITERQAAQLAIQVYKYRRQIGLNSPLLPADPPPGYTTPAMERDARRLAKVRAEYERSIATREPIARKVSGLLDDTPRFAFAGLTA